jgi:hypothetical protein
MLRRRAADLPTTLAEPRAAADGSVKSIKLETPLAKAIRSADGYTKVSYAWMFASILFIWLGWTWIRRNSASMVLDCHAGGCTLTIYTPYSFQPKSTAGATKKSFKRTTKIEISRDQLVRAENVKWDPRSNIIVENYGINAPPNANGIRDNHGEEDYDERRPNDRRPMKPKDKRKYKQKYPKYKKNQGNWNSGPDVNGNYDSYVIVLRNSLPIVDDNEDEDDPTDIDVVASQRRQRQMVAQRLSAMNDPNSLSSLLAPFILSTNGETLEFTLHPRDFNLGKTRRLARTSAAQINAYIKRRRAHCILRESRPVAWQGLTLLILGIFSATLCVLVGQFWEEYDPTKMGSYKSRMAEMRRREEAKKKRMEAASRRTTTRPTSNGNTPWSGTARGGGAVQKRRE